MLDDPLIEHPLPVDRVRDNEEHPQISWATLAGVMTSLSVFVLTLGLTYPLLALILEQ